MAHETTLPLIVKGGKLPINFQPTPQEYYQALVPRLSAEISDEQVILGSTDDDEPAENVGPWFSDNSWRFWDVNLGQYVGTMGIFDAPYTVRLTGEPTADRKQIFPNKSGTLALLLDTYIPRETDLPETGSTVTIDGSVSNSFIARLSQNTTISLVNINEADKLTIVLINNGTEYTVTWPVTVKWSAAHAQPVAEAGQSAVGVYIIRQNSAPSKTKIGSGESAELSTIYGSADFVAGDVGWYITGDNIPDDTYLVTVNTGLGEAVMSNAATGTGTGLDFTLTLSLFGELAGSYNASNEASISTDTGGTGSVGSDYGENSGTPGQQLIP